MKVWADVSPGGHPCPLTSLKGGHISHLHRLGFLLQNEEYYVNNILIILQNSDILLITKVILLKFILKIT